MEVNIKIRFNSSAQGSTAVIPQLKYNKTKGWFAFELDDGSVSSKHILQKMKTTTYTDGCGNLKPYTAGLALNARRAFDNLEIGTISVEDTEAIGSINYAEQMQFITEGWDLMNHSYYHEIDSSQTGVPVWGYGNNPQRNIDEMDALILFKHDYKMNTMVVPSDYEGFMLASKAIGYLGGSSTGTFDGLPIMDADNYFFPKKVSTLNNLDYQAVRRDFAISGWQANSGVPWDRLQDMINSTEKGLIEIGTHTMNATEEQNFRNWIQAIKDSLGDTILFTSLREFLEYQHLRFNVVKTETIVGNELRIKIDYSGVPNQFISWHDLSFLVEADSNIQSVEVDNELFNTSFNSETNLVNINYRKTNFTELPPADTFKIFKRFVIV